METNNRYSCLGKTIDIRLLLALYLFSKQDKEKEMAAEELGITTEQLENILSGNESPAEDTVAHILTKSLSSIDLMHVMRQLFFMGYTQRRLKNYEYAVVFKAIMLGKEKECILAIQQGRDAFDMFADSIGITSIHHPAVIQMLTSSSKLKANMEGFIAGALWQVGKKHI